MNPLNEPTSAPGESNCRLREILVKLHDRLSDADRRRLHFYLGDDVPRRIRDDPTSLGTLSLMESLIDQNKINEKDFTYLIHAFQVIGCHDLAQNLREYKARSQPFGTGSSSIIDLILTESSDRAPPAAAAIPPRPVDPQRSKEEEWTLLSESTRSPSSLSDSGSRKPPNLRLYRNLFRWVLPLLIVLSASLLYLLFFAKKPKCSFNPQLVDQEQNSFRLQMELNRTIASLSARNASLSARIESFPYLFGEIRGEAIGKPFNDSATEGFDSSYLLSGFRRYKDYDEEKYTYHFIYRSKSDKKQPFEGEKRPQSDEMSALPDFKFASNDKIRRVSGHIVQQTVRSKNGTKLNQTIINGLQFYSHNSKISPSFNGQEGVPFSEEYPGYSIHSVRGYMDKYIHQIQFVWYYTKPI